MISGVSFRVESVRVSASWKLIGNVQSSPDPNLTADDKRLFLSNLATDVSETTNLASQHPQLTARLESLHDDWLAASLQPPVAPAPVQDEQGNEQ